MLSGWRSIHSIATEPAPQPISHSTLPGTRGQGGERDGADLALGDLAVMLEQIIRQPGGQRDHKRARLGHQLHRHQIQRVAVQDILLKILRFEWP